MQNKTPLHGLFLAALFVVVGALQTAPDVSAQPYGSGPHGPGMGAGMGQGPGMGNMPSFAAFDRNGDGVLTEQEFLEGHAERIRERSQQGYPMRNLAHAPTFADFDQDGNGQVTPEEFAAGQVRHRQTMQQPPR